MDPADVAFRQHERSKPEAATANNYSEPAMRQSAKESVSEPAPTIYETSRENMITEEPANNINGILKSAIRQTAILDRIRQTGNCRLKDIQEVLPEASERTIRYDLQTLLEQNLIERVGNAGPSVFYRVNQATQIA